MPLVMTDLAGGPIPPGIGIPGDVELPDPGSLPPGRTLQDLLGDNEFESRYAPGEQPLMGEPPFGRSADLDGRLS